MWPDKGRATEHSLTPCRSYLGWQQALTDWAEPLQRQDACRGAKGLPHKRCYFAMPIRTQLSSSSRNLSQANIYTYQRKPKTIRFFWRQLPLKYVLQNKFAVRQTGRVPGSWLCYYPWGTAKLIPKIRAETGDPKQHLCHDTYFFKRSVITHGNWKQPWIRYFTKLSFKLKSDGRRHQASFSSSPCKHSNNYFCFMEQNNYQ